MHPDRASTHEGYATVHGYRLYWKSVGDPGPAGTVVALHGGPGATHDYLLSLSDLAQWGYRVVYYDQIGCGRSDLARDVNEYTIERDVEDLDALRKALGLERFHLIGSSYGGLLAIAYALAHPEPLRSLVSASGLVDVPFASREMQRLKRELPASVLDVIDRHEAVGEFQHPEYLAAVLEFYRRHVCRLPVWPAELSYSLDRVTSSPLQVGGLPPGLIVLPPNPVAVPASSTGLAAPCGAVEVPSPQASIPRCPRVLREERGRGCSSPRSGLGRAEVRTDTRTCGPRA